MLTILNFVDEVEAARLKRCTLKQAVAVLLDTKSAKCDAKLRQLRSARALKGKHKSDALERIIRRMVVMDLISEEIVSGQRFVYAYLAPSRSPHAVQQFRANASLRFNIVADEKARRRAVPSKASNASSATAAATATTAAAAKSKGKKIIIPPSQSLSNIGN